MATHDKTQPTLSTAFINARGEECTMRDAAVMRHTFSNGDTITLTENELAHVARECFWHGAKQKTIDAAAISRNPETGRSATVADKFAAVHEVAARLVSGEWNKTREGTATGGLLLSALVRLYDGRKTREELVAFLESKTDAEKAALRKNGKVAPIIEAIRAERAKDEGVDSDDLLSALDE